MGRGGESEKEILKFRGHLKSSRKLLLSHCLTSLKSCPILKLTVEMGIKAELEKQKKPLWVLGF